MASIGWLHLTDLHFGLPGQKWLWPTVKEQFYRDLERLHAKSGPWDLVLFTGDLTQRGTKEEFDRLTETLGKLWDHLAKLGSKPALITVPGNHDLQRPKVTPTVRALRNWHTDGDLREEFWASADNEYQVVVNEAFVSYEGFVKAHPLPADFTVRQGILPGDRTISLERDGLKLALVGLNSAFLQLEGGDYQGKLDLDVRQLHGVCDDDPPEWLGQHHAALLLTHHPTTWFSPRAVADFKADIAPPGRFVAHLFGHMHEGSTTSLAVSGSSPQRSVQGPSLFGLETWGEGTEQRIHGYMAGRITIEDTQGTFTLWPRELRRNRAGAWQMAPDFSFDLHEEAAVEEFKSRKAAVVIAPASATADAVAELIFTAAHSAGAKVTDQESTPVRNGVFDLGATATDFFVGRAAELGQIDAAFTALDDSGVLIHALSGLGGAGKTQIALEYVRRRRDQYHDVFWISGESAQSIDAGLERVARLLGLVHSTDGDQRRALCSARQWLDAHANWLLIVDNLDHPELLRDFRPKSRNGHLLITSREQVFHALGDVTITFVERFSSEDAQLFLLRRTAQNDAEATEAMALVELVRQLGELPLALEQAAAFIVEHQCRFDDYLQSYLKRRLQLLEKMRPIAGDYRASVCTTWAMSFASLERHAAAADLLRLSAFLHPDAIPFELLTAAPTVIGGAIAEALGSQPSFLDIDELVTPLARQSLVRRDKKTRRYSLHRLVQEVVRTGMGYEDRRAWAARAVCAVSAAMPDEVSVRHWQNYERLLPHALVCSDLIEELCLDRPEAGRLLDRLAYYLDERGRYAESEAMYLRALASRSKISGEDSPEAAETLNHLAWCCSARGRYADAETYYRRALGIRETKLGARHAATATTLSNLGALLHQLDQNDEAEALQRRALLIREEILPPGDAKIASSLNRLSTLCGNCGRIQEALGYSERALLIKRSSAKLGPEHPDTAAELNQLAWLHRKSGNAARAEELHRRALEIQERVLGDAHPYIAHTLDRLAALLREENRLAEAGALLERALGVWRACHREDHPDMAFGLVNLGLVRFAEGRLDEAATLMSEALRIRERVLPTTHRFVQRTQRELQKILDAQAKAVGAC